MKNIFQLSLILFFSCASQGMPSGGPVDKEGPIVLKFSEEMMGINESITISFSEIIKPASVIQSITINGENFFKIQTKYNKVIIHPIDVWPKIIELNISRNIEDYQGNIMDTPITKIFKTEIIEISKGIINGELINISNDKIYEIGLYQIKDDSLFFIKKTEANKEGVFKFQNINDGQYRVCALDGIIDDFNKKYRFNRYGLQSKEIFISPFIHNFDIKIMMDNPLPKNKIIAGNMINGNYAILTLNDGTEKAIYLESERKSKRYLEGDSIYVSIYNENRLGEYLMEPFDFLAHISSDTISANLEKHYIDNNILFINFSEPVKLLKNDIFFDRDGNILTHNIINPFILSIDLNKENVEKINIKGNFISDYNDNLADSLITIDIPIIGDELEQKFGSLKGKVNYRDIKDIVVRLTNIDSNNQYHTLIKKDSTFIFNEILPGDYILDSYERKLADLMIYYSGQWDPFNYAAKFTIYPENIDIRAHWIIEGVEIDYD